MNYDEVCAWLGLPPGSWPPDYYALLGLPPGDADFARIEQHVQERMFLLRCRQLARPELATEAMNVLAKAFACLTDPVAKQRYDANLLRNGTAIALSSTQHSQSTFGAVSTIPAGASAWVIGGWNLTIQGAPAAAFVENWVTGPPPEMRITDIAPSVEVEESGRHDVLAVAPSVVPSVVAPTAPPPDPIEKMATSVVARQGLGTKRAMYERLARTRHLHRAWNAAGKFLSDPERPLAKSAEAVELARLLSAVRRRLRDFPPLLGEAGQPGFYVVTLASQPRKAIVATFRMLLPSQRDVLTRDWQDGVRLLAAHRRFVREEIKGLRRKHWVGRAFRTVDIVLTDHPGWLLGAIVLVALVVATWLGLAH